MASRATDQSQQMIYPLAQTPGGRFFSVPQTNQVSNQMMKVSLISSFLLLTLSVSAEEKTGAKDCFNKGIAYGEMGNLDKALVSFSETIRLDPKLPKAHFYRGSVYFAKRDFDKAVADFTEAIKNDPKVAICSDRLALASLVPKEGCLLRYLFGRPGLRRAVGEGYRCHVNRTEKTDAAGTAGDPGSSPEKPHSVMGGDRPPSLLLALFALLRRPK